MNHESENTRFEAKPCQAVAGSCPATDVSLRNMTHVAEGFGTVCLQARLCCKKEMCKTKSFLRNVQDEELLAYDGIISYMLGPVFRFFSVGDPSSLLLASLKLARIPGNPCRLKA